MNIVGKFSTAWTALVKDSVVPLRVDANGRLLASISGSGGADITNPAYVKSASYIPLGYTQMTSAELAAAAVLESVPVDAKVAIIHNSGSTAVRWRDDGVDPTAAIGMLISSGERLTYDGNLSAMKLIRVADGAILDISYYK